MTPQSKQVHKEYMRKRREGSQNEEQGSQRTQHLAEALIDPVKRAKLTMISKALDKTMTGLDGKPLRLGTMVRYGINGYTLNEISQLLT